MADKKSRKSVEYGIFYISMKKSLGKNDKGKSLGSGEFNLAWRAPIDVYPKDIAAKLGVNKVNEKKQEASLVFGCNSPRPARVRINVKVSQGKSKSYLVFASPVVLAGLVNGGILNGTKYRGGTITSVSIPMTSTNPSRSKKKKTKTPTKKR